MRSSASIPLTTRNPVPNTKFSDFWELLSDGRLARRENPDLQFLIATLSYTVAKQARRRAAGEEIPDPTIGIWEARQLKSSLRLIDDRRSSDHAVLSGCTRFHDPPRLMPEHGRGRRCGRHRGCPALPRRVAEEDES